VIQMNDKETTSTNTGIGDEEYKVTDLLEICKKDGRTALIHYRAEQLNSQELLEILISPGCKKSTAAEVAANLLKAFDGNLNFDIDDLSSEEQIIPPDEEYTEWVWNARPLKSGIQILTLIVTIRMQIPDHGEEKWDLPALEEEVTVKVNPIYTIREFFGDNWQWVVTTVISSSIIGWFVKKRRGGNKE